MELSCGLPPGPDFADLAVLAESLGYARVWIYDSAPLWEDPFIHLALAATRTSGIGLGTAVLVPSERTEMAMASSIAAITRLSAGRFRPCFGTGFTARKAMGQRALTLDELFGYVARLRGLLAGETVEIDGAPARMIHAPGLSLPRPIDVELWLSVFGPKGSARAAEVADGVIGMPHPTLPTATMISGTVLDAGEEATSDRVRAAIAPWRVVDSHSAYVDRGPSAVDALPGGSAWRAELDVLEAEGRRHLLAFEGHVTQLTERDRHLAEHIDTRAFVGDREKITAGVAKLAGYGYGEVIYTPSGPDVARELSAFADAVSPTG